MNRFGLVLFSLLFVFMITACGNTEVENKVETEGKVNDEEKVEVFISAAASLTDAMDEIKPLYEEANNVELTFNFGGSGKLAQQIQQGAPVDVFISANENWMDTLEEEDFIIKDTRTDVTGNKLVLVASTDSAVDYKNFDEINKKDVEKIAIGNPESVPAGEYTEAVLKSMDKWDELEDNFVFAQDVRQVLTYVETGNAEIGFVYQSDAISTDKVKVLAESDPALHDAIIYPGAVTTDSEHMAEAEKFLEFMTSEEGQSILETYGFTK